LAAIRSSPSRDNPEGALNGPNSSEIEMCKNNPISSLLYLGSPHPHLLTYSVENLFPLDLYQLYDGFLGGYHGRY
jgi:hypothetical protein